MIGDGYQAILFTAEHAAGKSCVVHPRGSAIDAIVAEGERVELPYSSIEISVTGIDDKYLCFEGTWQGERARVLVSDRGIISHLEGVGAPRRVLDQLEGAASTRSRRKVGRLVALGVVGALLAGALAIAWAALGWAVDVVVDEIPVEWEVEVGRNTAAGVLEESRVCSDPDVLAAMEELEQRLTGGLETGTYEWRIRVIDSDDVNAFALPGGYVFVNRGLIERARSGNEVAGVLAHEIQHVRYRHGMKNLVRQIGLALIVYAVVGDSGAVQQFVVGNAAALASMSYSRDQESEADLSGMKLIYRAAFEPTGLLNFMDTLAREEGTVASASTMLSTHPASEDRSRQLQSLIDAWGRPQVVPLSFDWNKIDGKCQPVTVGDPDQSAGE